MGRKRLVPVALTALLGAGLAVPTGAQGTLTIGSNLGRAPNFPLGCAQLCTVSQGTLAADRGTSAFAPVNGTVVLWRVRAGSSAGPIAFRVLRSPGGGLATGAGTSATVIPTANATSSFSVQLPIAIGDRIGLDCCVIGGGYFLNTGGNRDEWEPTLADGAPARVPDRVRDREIAMNADIEPTSAVSILKAKSKKGGKVQITAQVPNPGILAAGDKSTKLATPAGAGNKTKYLKTKTTQVAAPGQVTVVVKATKVARSVLADQARLKARLKLSFTPTGGTASTRLQNVKLKP